MAGRLDGKVAVITGTGRGIAREVALRFAAEGAKIVGCDIDATVAQETLEIVREAGGTMESLHPVDLTVEENAHALSAFAEERFGGIDILYNSAMSMTPGVTETLRREDWEFTLNRVLTLQWLVTKHAIRHFRARGGGSIIFVASVSADDFGGGYPGNMPIILPYAVAKAGVARLATVLANELSPINVRVNILSPSTVATPAGLTFYGQPGERRREIAEMGILQRRLAEPSDVAKAALFFASDDSAFITGQNLRVDGGYTVSGGVGPVSAELEEIMKPTLDALMQTDDRWTTAEATS